MALQTLDKPRQVLLVDDDQKILDLLTMEANKYHLTVRTATSATDAWDVIQTQDVNLLIVDGTLAGGQSGLALLRRVKRAHPSIPLFLFTGSESAYRESADLGVPALMKPGDFREIDAMFHEAKKTRLQRERKPSV